MKKIILRNGQSPGDIVILSYAIKSLHESHPNKFLTDVRTPCNEIFEGNPFIVSLSEQDPDVEIIDISYPTIHFSNQKPVHYVNGFTHELAKILGIKIEPTNWQGAIFIREEEKHWYSAIYEELVNKTNKGANPPAWILAVGSKKDFLIKQWNYTKVQQVIDCLPDITFVQIGLENNWHIQPKLHGKNLINLVNKTNIRQLIRLVYNSFGVLSYVSFPMVLAYAVPPHPRFNRKSRAAIILSGAREPNTWQQGPNQQLIHRCGMLPCADNGGCWKSRVVKIFDNDPKDEDLCLMPIQTSSGQWISKCMDMISAEEVIGLIKMYMDNLNYE